MDGNKLDSLGAMSIDKVKFERQRRIDQISRLSLEEARSRARAEQIDDMPPDPYDIDMTIDSGPTWVYVERLQGEIGQLQQEVNAIERELSQRL